MTQQKGSRVFFYGEKKEGENLGFECKANEISELVKLEAFDESWARSDVTGVDKPRGLYHGSVTLGKVEYEEIINRIKYMVSGRSHVFLVTTEDELYVCGYNAYLQCGCGEDTSAIPYFKRIDVLRMMEPLILMGKIDHDFRVTKIACGWVHSVLVINDKYLFGAGHNYFYQTGITQSGTFGDFTHIPLDHLDLPSNYKITHIDGGTFFTVFAVNNRKIYGAGSASLCNFGIKQNDNVNKYTFSYEFDCDISKIQTGYDHTLILLKDNRIFMSGKMEGGSGDSATISSFQQVELNASIHDWIDVGVCKFNYRSYVLKNDSLYQLSKGEPELIKQDKKYAGSSLCTSNLSLMIVSPNRQYIESRGNTGDTLFELDIPSGFKLDHVSAGYTAIYIIVKPKSSLIHFFTKLKEATQIGKLSDITIIFD